MYFHTEIHWVFMFFELLIGKGRSQSRQELKEQTSHNGLFISTGHIYDII